MNKEDLSINASDAAECSGCGVCLLVCPNKCIDILLNKDGYYEAIAEQGECSNCGICQSVCNKFFNQHELKSYNTQNVFLAYNKNEKIRKASSSGGIGTALVYAAIDYGYKVIGAAMDYNTLKVKHIVFSDKHSANKIRGSKYLPSYTYEGFAEIKKNEKYIVIGTPCQIAALRKAFGANEGYRDLILIDFRCFGHPGYNLMNKYRYYLESIDNSGIKEINMRDKSHGWLMWGVKTDFRDGRTFYANKCRDYFAIAFRSGQAIHDVCLKCDYYKNHSLADLRMEDAWHYASKLSFEDSKKGVSQVTIYSNKGSWLFQKARKYMEIKPVENNIENRSWTKVYRKPDLMSALRQNYILPDIIKSFWRATSIKERVLWNISYIVSVNFYLYKAGTIFSKIINKYKHKKDN